MNFNCPGYPVTFIQKKPCKDTSAHDFTLIYKFYSPSTGLHYILNADHHDGDFFAIKFYVKAHRHSEFKYSKITNRGDIGNILITCAKMIPLLLKQYPAASFGFSASRSVDKRTQKVESPVNNQRFKTYSYLAVRKIGTHIFAHYAYEKISSYLLVNRACGDVDAKERELVAMLSNTYNTLVDI